MGNKVLITGGCGYVGTMLALELLLNGHEVRVLDNMMHKPTAFLPLLANKRFEVIKGDIRDSVAVEKALRGIDFIYHLAAIVGMPNCKRDPQLAYETNVVGTKVINRMRGDIPIVYASTISLYGMSDKVCDETDKIETTSVYGQTKGEGEQEIMKSKNAVSLRFATLFGFSFEPRQGYMIINDFVKDAIDNNQLIIYDKDFKRSFVHLSDVVDAYQFTMDNFNKMNGQIFNIGNTNLNLSKEDIANAIKEHHEFDLFFKEGKEEDKRSYFVSYDKIKNLGWEAKIGLEDGIKELITGYKTLK